MLLANIGKKITLLLSKDRGFYLRLKSLLGVCPTNISYYKSAFTHRSMLRNKNAGIQHNERLEYLGDAMLGAIVADYLYQKYPSRKEGDLTKMRSRLVNRSTLQKVGKDMKLDDFLVSYINPETEGKYVLSNMVEALVGAIYLDMGYSQTKQFVINTLLKDILSGDIDKLDNDFKSRILEWGQKKKQRISFVSEQEIKEGGHVFISNILLNGQIISSGTGLSKKESEQNAAKNAWENSLKNTNNRYK